ncbi:MAG TPA: type IV pilus assembly protein PilM [Actinomycetota bacterium]|nr:type IV pilus assembly protein PilM [Actinomycetota bacterium]
MARTAIGLDVGATAVRAVELSLGSDPPALVRAAQVPLSPGAVRAGEIREVDAVTEAVRELWRRGRFRSKQATMGIGNQRVVVREVTVPALPPKELRQSLGYQVQDLIPIPVEDAVLDYDVLDEFEQDGARSMRLLVVAAQREMVGRFVEAASSARVQPIGVDLVPFALIRAVGQDEGLGLDEEDRGGEAIIDVGADVTNICVHERGVARFVRILPTGGRDVTVAMADALGIDQEQAEALKRGQPVETAPPSEVVRTFLEGRAATLVDEIRSSLDFYRTQTPDAEVNRILVTGGGSKLQGFLERLRERVTGRVERGRAFQKVAVELDMDEATMADAEPLLAVTLGLALPAG